MTDIPATSPLPTPSKRTGGWMNRLVASERFQTWAARFPLTRRIVRAEGEAMFDLVAGFCHSQILQALVSFDIPATLLKADTTAEVLASRARVPLHRMHVLLRASVAIGLLKQRRSGSYGLTRRGAALAGVPGLSEMIRHHEVLYRDLSDPVAFFRGETETELADFWPYVFGAGAASDPDQARRYSELMADSQKLVAADTLAVVNLKDADRLMDVGGGTGAFLAAVAEAHPDIALTLFDLPAVVPEARQRFDALAAAGIGPDRSLEIVAGSFRDQALPQGFDIISLVRVLYDHNDVTVGRLLSAVYTALPLGGRIIVSEPMTGGAKPERAGDAYFALYCMAMRTGRARSAKEIMVLLRSAGFEQVKAHASPRPFITSVVEAVRLD